MINNNINNNNNNIEQDHKYDESKDESKDNNSDETSHVLTAANLSRLDMANNNNNSLMNDDNDNKEIEEMTEEEIKFVQDVTKEIFDEFSKWNELFRCCIPNNENENSYSDGQNSIGQSANHRLRRMFASEASSSDVRGSNALTYDNANNCAWQTGPDNSSVTNISDTNNKRNKHDKTCNIQNITNEIIIWLTDYQIDREIRRKYKKIYQKSKENNEAIQQMKQIHEQINLMRQDKYSYDHKKQAQHFQIQIEDFIDEFGACVET